ncbi:ComEA family DNA-binding protein [Actinomadura sp. DC4]|uniref:ComEA family DNA-binding protein n=1 Tax=Actinomadura sp. DC4 TaxID=3055069 RepID=UPI0025B08ADD|nr:ComEA family DNA-binding protein [Actinomadura sp. DC4]MDN3353490.1 ComEA family DNA-binding protein [Actinomadura sp. DC4]
MKRPVSASAFDRLREAFRPPQSFGAVPSPPEDELGRAGPEEAWLDGGRRLRIDPGFPGVRVLALAGLLAALLAGAYFWWSRPQPQPAPQPVLRPAAQPAAVASAAPSSSPTAAVVVDVAGKVRRPGVVSLPSGARVIDAIKEAGGVRPGAKTGTLNLARRVVDGEQILVGVNATPAPAVPPTAPAGSPAPGAPLDLNAATVPQLDQLPGVGPVLAQRIVDYRAQHGNFHTTDELRQVSGIGDAKFADLKDLVRV